MFDIVQRLHAAGVMGINRRNADYALRYNQRRLYPLVDNKLLTKRLAKEAGIATPELYHIVEIEQQIKGLPEVLEQFSDFVLKPAQGFGGDGIIAISGRRKGMYRKASGALLSAAELQHHVSNILNGLYSLGGRDDVALFEYFVKNDPIFEDIAYLGVPDIRIIVLLGIPVMAMVRLPTQMSDGKANLHQGAIGSGIDIASGKTLSAVWNNAIIDEHPDTGSSVLGVQIPHWNTVLEIAARCYEMTGLGYQGVDIVLDRDKGPLILEINARPGLNIQIANRSGLLSRLQQVENEHEKLLDVEARITFAKKHFGIA
jgi:alpha-L-glutamate ligase-like protein